MRRWELTGSEYTKYWRVSIMWHTTELVKIFEKITDEYADAFPSWARRGYEGSPI